MIHLNNLKKKLLINNSHQLSLYALIATLVTGFISHYLLIRGGFTNPDGICEGLTYYMGGDWALVGCGRWAIRYLNKITCNIVIPLYVVLMYCLCIWLSIILLSKIWEFSAPSIIVLSVIMISTPAVTNQFAYTYTALAYGVSCVLSVLFVYVIFRCNYKKGVIVGTLSVSVMLGLYQSYVGMVAVLVFMTIIVGLFDYTEVKQLLKRFILCIISALVGCGLYNIILNIDMKIREFDNSGSRVMEFSITKIFKLFPERFCYVYKKYLNFFTDKLMHRNILYLLIFAFIVVGMSINVFHLLQKKKYGQALVAVLLFVLIPFSSNIIGILIPYNGISELMQYQTILIIPFMLTCIRKLEKYRFYKIFQGMAILIVGILAWTYILAANATYKCYELSYRHINSQMQIAVTRVYDLDGYIKDETPILIAGFPNDTVLRNNLDIYQYAENLCENPAFWLDMHGATQNRYLYFMNYFGIDAQRFSDDEYESIINTAEFAEMPVWPDKRSVEMINGYAVVKFMDEPPMP